MKKLSNGFRLPPQVTPANNGFSTNQNLSLAPTASACFWDCYFRYCRINGPVDTPWQHRCLNRCLIRQCGPDNLFIGYA